MRKTVVWIIILLCWSIPKTKATPSQIDSLKILLAHSESPEKEIRYLIELSDSYLFLRPDSSLFYALKARKLNETFGKNESAGILLRIGQAYWSMGRLGSAMDYMTQALEVSKAEQEYNLQARALNGKGIIFAMAGDNVQALNFFKESLKIYEDLKLDSRILVIRNNIGKSYLDINQIDSARIYLERGLAMIQESEEAIKPIMLFNYGETYFNSGQYDKAKELWAESLQLSHKLNDKRAKIYVFERLSKLALIENDLEKALDLSSTALEEAKITNIPDALYKCYRTHAEILKQIGNHEEALNTYQKYISTKDSVQNNITINKLSLQNYKEKELELLVQNKLAETMLAKRRGVITALILICISIIIISLILWRKRFQDQITKKVLADSEARYRLLAENSSDGVAAINSKNEITYLSPSIKKKLGVSDKQPFNNFSNLIELIHPDDQERIKNQISKVDLNGSQKEKYQYRLLNNANEYVWVEDLITRKYDQNDQLIASYINSRDITDRVHFEQELKKSKDLLDATSQMAKVGGWEFDLHSNEMEWTDEVYRIFNVSKQFQPDLENTTEFFNTDAQIAFRQAIEEAQYHGKSFDLELILKTQDKVEKWIRVQGKSEVAFDQVTKIVGIMQDISSKKEMEEVKRLAHQLKLKNKEMEQFAYIASHDLQEPLRTVISFIQLLKRKYDHKLDEEGHNLMRFITDASGRMSQLIEGLLNYSRLGKYGDAKSVNLNTVVKIILEDMKAVVDETGATFKIDALPTIQGYELEIRQLFQNLISNALKFKKENISPIIKISASFEKPYWTFAVNDNGIGIEAKYQERIFNIFQRLHNRTEYEGTGIGLANCRKIVDIHQGKIWVESQLGTGSTFFFTIKT